MVMCCSLSFGLTHVWDSWYERTGSLKFSSQSESESTYEKELPTVLSQCGDEADESIPMGKPISRCVIGLAAVTF